MRFVFGNACGTKSGLQARQPLFVPYRRHSSLVAIPSTRRPSMQTSSKIPADDPQRKLSVARPDSDNDRPHIGIVGDTYTILLASEDTAGRFCLIDMHVPPGGGPPPHRHDFEETFTLLEGEIVATFRGVQPVVRAGETINIPANAPHQFTTHPTNPPGCYARVRPPVRRTCSSRSESAWRLEQRRHRSSMRRPRQNSERK